MYGYVKQSQFWCTVSPAAVAKDARRYWLIVVDEVDIARQAYCETGRLPRAVGEHPRDGAVSQAFARDIVDWLAPDVTPGDAPESVLRLLSALAARMTSPLNVRRTAEELGTTRERLTTRLNRLFTTFAAVACPQIDASGTPVPGSQAKVYLLDPLLISLPHLIEPRFPAPDVSAVSEATLALAMARAVDSAHPGRLLEGRAVGYGRTSGSEIDLAPIPLRRTGTGSRVGPHAPQVGVLLDRAIQDWVVRIDETGEPEMLGVGARLVGPWRTRRHFPGSHDLGGGPPTLIPSPTTFETGSPKEPFASARPTTPPSGCSSTSTSPVGGTSFATATARPSKVYAGKAAEPP